MNNMSVQAFLHQFSDKFSVGVIVAVLVWGLVQGFKRTIFNPIVLAIYPTRVNDFEVKLTDDEVLLFGEFFAEVAHFIIGMITVYAIWYMSRVDMNSALNGFTA